MRLGLFPVIAMSILPVVAAAPYEARAETGETSASTRSDESRPAELFVEARFGGQHAYSPSFDALGSGETPNVYGVNTVGAGYRFGEALGLSGFGVVGIVETGAVENRRFDEAYDFEWRRTLLLAGLQYDRPLGTGSWFRPFVRAAAGVAPQRLTVTPEGDDAFTQAHTPFALQPSGGIEVHTPYNSGGVDRPALSISKHFALGATAQIGYLWQPKTHYDALTAEDDDRWSRSGLDFGPLDAAGWFWSFGATLRLRP